MKLLQPSVRNKLLIKYVDAINEIAASEPPTHAHTGPSTEPSTSAHTGPSTEPPTSAHAGPSTEPPTSAHAGPSTHEGPSTEPSTSAPKKDLTYKKLGLKLTRLGIRDNKVVDLLNNLEKLSAYYKFTHDEDEFIISDVYERIKEKQEFNKQGIVKVTKMNDEMKKIIDFNDKDIEKTKEKRKRGKIRTKENKRNRTRRKIKTKERKRTSKRNRTARNAIRTLYTST